MILLLVVWGNTISKNKQNVNSAKQSTTHYNRSNGHDLHAHIMWENLLGSSSSASVTNFVTAGLRCLLHLNPDTSDLAPPKFMPKWYHWIGAYPVIWPWAIQSVTSQSRYDHIKPAENYQYLNYVGLISFVIKSGQFWWKYSSLGHFLFGEWWPSEAVIVS